MVEYVEWRKRAESGERTVRAHACALFWTVSQLVVIFPRAVNFSTVGSGLAVLLPVYFRFRMAPERSSTSARPETEEPGYGSDSSSSSDSDPIIKRIPIYYASSYLHDVTLLQYLDRPPKPFTQHPLLPPSLRPEAEDPPVDTADIEIKARYKPNSRHMVMQVPIEKHETRFNVEAAERLGAGLIADAGAGKEKKKKKRGQDREEAEEDKPALLVEKILLESLVVPDVVNYAVGILRDGELLSTLLQQCQHTALETDAASSLSFFPKMLST